jgi:hypothetical protein
MHEKNTLEKLYENKILKENQIINFSDLEYPVMEKNTNSINILILGDITYGTGNLITAQRMKRIFNNLGFNTFIYNIRYLLSEENKNYKNLKKFIKNMKIGLFIGINIWRSGKIIHHLLNDSKLVCLNSFTGDSDGIPNLIKVIPFFFIVAGTDANCFIKVKSI